MDVSASLRIKEQVKSRMEVLLQEETQARENAAKTAPEQASRTGQTSLSASVTSRAGSTCDSAKEGGTGVGVKADLVFNVDTGERLLIRNTAIFFLSLPISLPFPLPPSVLLTPLPLTN